MELDRLSINWLATSELIRSALRTRGENIVWLSAQLAEQHGFSDSSRSELYALSKGKPFKLSERKLSAIFDVLKIQPVPLKLAEGSGGAGGQLAYCRNVHCRSSRWELMNLNGWTVVPAPQWVSPGVEDHCRFCGEKGLVLQCPSCAHPVVEGSHCPKCGSPYTAFVDEELIQLIELSPATDEQATREMLWRKIRHLLPDSSGLLTPSGGERREGDDSR